MIGWFLLGLVFGNIIGYGICALLTASAEADEKSNIYLDKDKDM